jgi:hypothetical protein
MAPVSRTADIILRMVLSSQKRKAMLAFSPRPQQWPDALVIAVGLDGDARLAMGPAIHDSKNAIFGLADIGKDARDSLDERGAHDILGAAPAIESRAPYAIAFGKLLPRAHFFKRHPCTDDLDRPLTG